MEVPQGSIVVMTINTIGPVGSRENRSSSGARVPAASIVASTMRGTLAATFLGLVTVAGAAEIHCAPGPLAVPDGSGAVEQVILVPAAAPGVTLASVQVGVELTHPWIGDLRLLLRHPSGAEVLLVDRPGLSGATGGLGFPGPWGCGGNGLDVTFEDAAVVAAEDACETVGVAMVGAKRPEVALDTLVGLSPGGAWTLVIEDQVVGDAGVLASVCLSITTAVASTCPEDLDQDGVVAGSDLAVLLGLWGRPCEGCGADLTSDGLIDAADLALLLGAWGVCPSEP